MRMWQRRFAIDWKASVHMTERTRGRLPDFIIIGAMKSGTSSLYFYLDQHPDISMSPTKELRFFIAERNWSKGLEWYRSQFPADGEIVGEATPGYTNYPERRGIADRMHRVVPDAKLIYLVRDPIERAISHYIHQVSSGREQRPLDQALLSENESYITRSKYHLQVEQYLKLFPAQNLLVVSSSDLRHNRIDTLQGIFRYLGVNDDFVSREFSVERGQSRGRRRPTAFGVTVAQTTDRVLSKLPTRPITSLVRRAVIVPFSQPMAQPVLDDQTRRRLQDLLRDDVAKFRSLTGQAFSDWAL